MALCPEAVEALPLPNVLAHLPRPRRVQGAVMDRRPYVTRRDLPAIVFCYAVVWVPIVVAIAFTFL